MAETAESVFIAGLFVHCAPDYADLAEAVGEPAEAASGPRGRPPEMTGRRLDHGWDGDWFVRAYDFFGNKVGSSECDEGQIYIEPQGFCVMAGIGVETGEAARALDSVKEILDSDHGIVVLQPAYTTLPPRARRDQHLPARLQGERRHLLPQQPLGDHRRDEAGSRRPGLRVLEEDRTGLPRGDLGGAPDRALRLLADDRRQGRSPPRRGQELVAHRHRSLELRGDLAAHPRGPARVRGLRVEPCLPQELADLHFVRHCRGAEYRVNIINGSGDGPTTLTVNGQPTAGTLVPYATPRGR